MRDREPDLPARQLPPYARVLVDEFGTASVRKALDAMRGPEVMMTKERLRLIKASPLSFARSLVDRMSQQRWSIERTRCDVDAEGRAFIVYRIDAEGYVLTFAVQAPPLETMERSGRIKDNALDFYAVLFDGEADEARIRAEGAEQQGKVWKGRSDNTILGWTFANRSNRLFDHCIDELGAGRQPDLAMLAENGGYLIRNAGFYGNGRHGSRTWWALPDDHPLADPYHVDLFCLYLWRSVGYDLVEGIARARHPQAARLSGETKRYLGVGNSSGIGMVAALVRWPHWVSGFCFAREFALALALTQPSRPDDLPTLVDLLERAAVYYRENDPSIDPSVEDRLGIAAELEQAAALARQMRAAGPDSGALRRLFDTAQHSFSTATLEQIAALIVETRADLASRARTIIPRAMRTKRVLAPEMSVGQLRAVIARDYDWALAIDFAVPGADRYFWYRSEENGENRRGERAVDPGVENETFVNVAGAIQQLDARLAQAPADWTAARYLLDHPDDVYLVTRVQSLGELPYAEIRSNLIHEAFRPSDLIQFYLSVLGMETTNPGNFRWVRGVFMQGAPLPEDLTRDAHLHWVLPILAKAPGAADYEPIG